MEEGTGDYHFPRTPREHYRPTYVAILDQAVEAIKQRFDQPGFGIYQKMQDLLLRAIQGKPYLHLLATELTKLYGSDLDIQRLLTQLEMLQTTVSGPISTFSDIVKWFAENPGLTSMFSEVKVIIKLILVLPATNAVSERSFSTLRRVKSYLRSTMTESRLNSLLTLHTYKEMVDLIDPQDIVRSYVGVKEGRLSRIAISE